MNLLIMRSPVLRISFLLISAGFLILLPWSLQSYGQSTGPAEIQISHASRNQLSLEEKIYVHTDRSFYLCGEVLWFKTYLTNAATNQPQPVSKIVYIDIINKKHQPVLQAKIAVDSGMGNGSFYLPFSVASGNYILRAYTNWMRNFSPENYFEKNISITNTSLSLDSSGHREPVNYVVDFFPEGGSLVNGLESKIAFKVNDNRNKGTDCEGVIVDQFKDTVTHFKSHLFGMGYFSLKPESGKNYTAVITFKNGTSIRKDLPEANNTGYVMHIADTGLNDLKISISAKRSGESLSPMYVIIQNNSYVDLARSRIYSK